MRNKLLLILCAAFLCACEGLKDDRNRPVPDNPAIAWLLSVEIDKLPSGTVAYDCSVYVAENPNDRHDFMRTEINLPELLKIPGARLLKKNEHIAVTIIASDKDANITDTTFILPQIPEIRIDTIQFNVDSMRIDTIYNYPQIVNFKSSRISGKYHFRYD